MKWTVPLVAITLLLTSCGPFGTYPAAPGDGRPQALTATAPQAGGTACPTSEISATFQVSDPMLKDGQVNPAVFSLTIDGTDVTGKADIRTTMEFPPSRADLVYRPTPPLKEGRHSISATFPGADGSKQRYTWSFTATPSACQ